MSTSQHSHTAPSATNDSDHHPDSAKQALLSLDNNRGWLEPTSVKVVPSLSYPSDRSHPAGRKPDKKIAAEAQKAKDMLGAVSNEDIMKLTLMTKQPIEMPRKYTHKDQRHHRSTDENTKTFKTKAGHGRHASAHQVIDADQSSSGLTKSTKSNESIGENSKDSPEPHLNDPPAEHINYDTTDFRHGKPRFDPLSRISGTSVSTEDLTPKSQISSISPPTRPSMSTPPPSAVSSPSGKEISNINSQELFKENTATDNRRSWYQALIKRDKSKGKSRADGDNSRPTEGSRLSTESDRSQPGTPTEFEPVSMIRENSRGSTTSNKKPTQDCSNRQRSTTSSTDVLKRMSSLHHTTSMKSRLLWTASRYQRTSSSALPTTFGDPSLHTNNREHKHRYDERRHSFDSMQSIMKGYAYPSAKANKSTGKLRHRISTGGIINHRHDQNDERHRYTAIQNKEKTPLLADNNVDYSALVADEQERTFLNCLDNQLPANAHLIHNSDDPEAIDNYISDADEIYPSDSEYAIKSNCASVSDSDNRKVESTEDSYAVKSLLFDYDTLPDEIISLLKKYEADGKMELKYRKVKRMQTDDNLDNDNEDNDHDDDNDDDDDEEEEEDIVGFENIDGDDLALVHASQGEPYEFVKLTQLADDSALGTGPLVDIHVCLLGGSSKTYDANEQEEIQIFSKTVDERLEDLKIVSQKAKQFLSDHRDVMDSLGLDDIETAYCNQNGSKSFLKEDNVVIAEADTMPPSIASSRYSYSSIRRAPSLLLNNIPYRSVNPFDYRQEEVRLGVEALRNEMLEFKRALCSTEELVRDVQIDVNDTRNRMEVYIKDIPESQYSALKKLEVDIESILANRAKNPWMDTGYALLSYLLTGVWIVICILKWGRKVVLFPHKLWKTYSEYLVERNKAVKRASMRSVVGITDRSREGGSMRRNYAAVNTFNQEYGSSL
ncbi:hypothetical protein DFQ29_000068 [Apophysomyces sp. BC1021]|nr:hypothetical protein DFQ29_000001 [Apophysomyces sp. BC1021]KAG0183643.1 hypothetical protein DFQ29_000068 [Apophysomyces sp. BC1021]